MLPMSSTLVFIGLFVVLLALLPAGLKWVRQRCSVGGAAGMVAGPRIISAIAVGPHQRVVTVEVGPEGARTWLTLGVTAQTITCLHSAALASSAEMAAPQAMNSTPVLS
jgi:flagellar protein FliO/FliZ